MRKRVACWGELCEIKTIPERLASPFPGGTCNPQGVPPKAVQYSDHRMTVVPTMSDMTDATEKALARRIKQHVIGRVTREDHGQIMNTMIRFYSEARDAEQKQAMAFELSPFDHKVLKFGKLFRERFMKIEVSLPLEDALNLCWQTLAECFEPHELLMKESLVEKYFPREINRVKSA